MKKLLILCSFVCMCCAYQRSLADEEILGDFDPVEYFLSGIGESYEAYLVCVYAWDVEPRTDSTKRHGWEETRIDSTIVQVIKGKRSVGEKFSYVRAIEGKVDKAFIRKVILCNNMAC